MSNCSFLDCVFDVKSCFWWSQSRIFCGYQICFINIMDSLSFSFGSCLQRSAEFSFIFLLQHCPREHTHTLKHCKHRFPVSLGTLSPPFPGFLPKITKVTFSKVIFLSGRGKCWKIGMDHAIFMAEHSRMSFWIPFLKIMQVEMVFWKLISYLSPPGPKHIHPWCNKVMLQINRL